MRPGGGGHYSGGGGFHGGGGGGFGGFHTSSSGGYHGGGSGIAVGGGVDFVTILILIAIWIVILLLKRAQSGDASARRALSTAQDDALAPLRRAASLDAIRARDPALTFESIEARVRRMNDVLVAAWCAGDMRPARPFVSDGVYSRFHVQLALMRAEGWRNAMADARALYVTLEGVESAAPLDVVHVRFTGRARDVDVKVDASADDVARALRRAEPSEYVEVWSLVRRHGATTTREASDLGRACPSCGAPIADGTSLASPGRGPHMTEGEMLKCRYCNALLCSGEHDWVLAEITQVSAWHPASPRIAGWDEARARDPGLAREVLEDRASYLFWKWVQSARFGSAAPLRKCATAELLATRARLERAASASDVAVGGADLIRLDARDGMDRAYVKVWWSAAMRRGDEPLPAQSVLRLVRKAGAASRPGLTALVCAACGAPIGESDTPTCDHCGALLASGDHDWVLDAIEAPGVLEAEARAQAGGDAPAWFVPDVIDPRERQVLFAQMAAVLAADGVIDPRERRLLEMCARRWAIPRETFDAVLAQPARTLDVAGSARPEWFLAGLVAAALADGKIDPRETALLERACDALRLPREELARQIDGCRARLRAEARS